MAGGHCFHIDQDGHSVTVLLAHPRGVVEVLVDGKVVACHDAPGKDATVLGAELPGDPPRPIRVLLAPVEGADGPPLCVMESDGARYPMPLVTLGRTARTTPRTTTTSTQAVRLLRRHVRRMARGWHR
ncbi:hypothetical protein [Streptomyces boluensis]|uniref:Uncharacterized protein n=1 Tax=Streptomyces boluensis TaxID=1775135 RepID=A0A964XQ17_9ACTN|nr:hypothetical protein [Streptomyces boluensis]NBE55163.1 hypothetical protein [Streptomyces boluensis]